MDDAKDMSLAVTFPTECLVKLANDILNRTVTNSQEKNIFIIVG